MYRREETGKHLIALCFCGLCFAITAYYLIVGYGTYLDADMSSELALASHLAKEGKLISEEWLYSTEVRVFSTQLVFTPLMALVSNNWRLVRTAGCMILMLMLMASAYYVSRTMGTKRHYAYIFAGLNVLPISIVYAQMIVIGAYYVPHAILINLFTAWAVGICKEKHRMRKAVGVVLLGTAMCATSIRYLLCAVLPATAAGLYMFIFSFDNQEEWKEGKWVAAILSIAAVCGILGYKLGEKLLAANFLWNPGEFGGRRLISLTSENLFSLVDQSMDGLLKLMGFREHRYLISVQGVLSLGVIGLLLLSVVLIVRVLRGNQKDHITCFGVLTLVMSAIMTLMTFMFIESMYVNRYWIPVMCLGGPIMALCLSKEKNVLFRRIGLFAFVFVVMGSSMVNIRDSMAAPEIDELDRASAARIEETGLSFGYASFWNANILSEITDGRIEVVSFKIIEEKETYPKLNSSWLEVKADMEMNRPEEPVFLLLTKHESEQFDAFLKSCQAEAMDLPDKGMNLYIVETQRRLFETIEAFCAAEGA